MSADAGPPQCSTLALDGVDDFVSVPDSPSLTLGSGDFTIEFYLDLNQIGNYQLIGHDTGNGLQNKWVVYFDGTSLALQIAGTGFANAPILFSHPWVPTANHWYHIAITRSGSDYHLFIDGVQVDTDSLAGAIPDPNAPLTFGHWEGATNFLPGKLAKVRLSSSVRYSANFTPPTSLIPDRDTIGLWYLLEGHGTTAYDASGNGHHGTLANGATWTAPAVEAFSCTFPAIDECMISHGECDPSATCTNTPNAWACSCNGGYSGDGFSCSDVNECLTNNGGCDPNAGCSNTAGSRTCACNGGFTGDGLTCIDVNECMTGNGGCDPHATCTNAPGSRTCACDSGYSGSGLSCSDINECLTSNGGCDSNATCTNTPGSRSCACTGGYIGTGLSCSDVDECLTGNGGCDSNATCTNTPGSRTCACNAGYSGDGTTCSVQAACTPGTQVFSTAGASTFVVPSGCTALDVSVWGSGGGGGSGCTGCGYGGAGGGGGFARGTFTVVAGSSHTVTVGSGGMAGAAGNHDGSPGGITGFGTLISATGGNAGRSTANGRAGGAGGAGSGGASNLTGGTGATGTQAAWGVGGSGAGPNGGAGGGNPSEGGPAATAPGGGGGPAGGSGQAPGSGARGQVTVTWGTTCAPALNFDGVDDLVTVPDSPLLTLGSSAFTIEFFLQLNQIGNYQLVGHDPGNGHQNKWVVYFDGASLALQIDGSGWTTAPILFSYPWSPMTNRWYHVAITRSGSAYNLFIDGALVDSDTFATAIPDPGSPLTFGWWEGPSNFLNGKMAEVRISSLVRYSSNFTPSASSFSSDTSTIGLWHLSEGSGTTATDSGPNHLNGTIGGGAGWRTGLCR